MTTFPSRGGPVGDDKRSDNEPMYEDSGSDELLPSAGDPNGLTPVMRQRLDDEVRADSPNHVVAVLRAHIADIDAQNLPDDDPGHVHNQAQRALAVAEISYLEERHGADPKTPAAQSASARASLRDDGPGDDDSNVRVYDKNR